ncbi:hypothetical protein FNF27_05980 [Cafeteria roenbergensis]|uniref:Uncharacterized protein n=3 Tax=Cafeteria roenbergensis TaxID=33653 RepID=A0A5A8E3Z3_CAFRO|nr:hypothetical protein FNF27_05980 [Cafeteria roenbergensis]
MGQVLRRMRRNRGDSRSSETATESPLRRSGRQARSDSGSALSRVAVPLRLSVLSAAGLSADGPHRKFGVRLWACEGRGVSSRSVVVAALTGAESVSRATRARLAGAKTNSPGAAAVSALLDDALFERTPLGGVTAVQGAVVGGAPASGAAPASAKATAHPAVTSRPGPASPADAAKPSSNTATTGPAPVASGGKPAAAKTSPPVRSLKDPASSTSAPSIVKPDVIIESADSGSEHSAVASPIDSAAPATPGDQLTVSSVTATATAAEPAAEPAATTGGVAAWAWGSEFTCRVTAWTVLLVEIFSEFDADADADAADGPPSAWVAILPEWFASGDAAEAVSAVAATHPVDLDRVGAAVQLRDAFALDEVVTSAGAGSTAEDLPGAVVYVSGTTEPPGAASDGKRAILRKDSLRLVIDRSAAPLSPTRGTTSSAEQCADAPDSASSSRDSKQQAGSNAATATATSTATATTGDAAAAAMAARLAGAVSSSQSTPHQARAVAAATRRAPAPGSGPAAAAAASTPAAASVGTPRGSTPVPAATASVAGSGPGAVTRPAGGSDPNQVRITVSPHHHSRYCDRTLRVCTAEGRFREGNCVTATAAAAGPLADRLRAAASSDAVAVEWFVSAEPGSTGGAPATDVDSGGAVDVGGSAFVRVKRTPTPRGWKDLALPEGSEADLPDDWAAVFRFAGVPTDMKPLPAATILRACMALRRGGAGAADVQPTFSSAGACGQWLADVVTALSDPASLPLVPSLTGRRVVVRVTRRSDGHQWWSSPSDTVEAAPPRCRELWIDGAAAPGGVLRARTWYWGGSPGPCAFHWVRVSEDGDRVDMEPRTARPGAELDEAAAALQASEGAGQPADGRLLVVRADDIGCKFKITAEPTRADGMVAERTSGRPTARVTDAK